MARCPCGAFHVGDARTSCSQLRGSLPVGDAHNELLSVCLSFGRRHVSISTFYSLVVLVDVHVCVATPIYAGHQSTPFGIQSAADVTNFVVENLRLVFLF